MAIKVLGGLKVITADPIETRLVLTKEQMLSTKDEQMPDVYFTICSEDGNLYLYNKKNEIDKLTGRYRIINEQSTVQVAQKIQRADGKPADSTTSWVTLQDAQDYAFHDNTSYVGQIIYVEEKDSFYKIGKSSAGATLLSKMPDEKFIDEINTDILNIMNKLAEYGDRTLAQANSNEELLILAENLQDVIA